MPPEEVGALQGAADSVRTISSVIAAPLMTRVFAHFIGASMGSIPRPERALFSSSLFSLIAFVVFRGGANRPDSSNSGSGSSSSSSSNITGQQRAVKLKDISISSVIES